jgi:hypothetical protein
MQSLMQASMGLWHTKLIWKTWPQISFKQKQPKEITKNMYTSFTWKKLGNVL